MNSAKLNDWMQVIGIFALVASLIFVGLQMRQEHEIARVQIYQERASTAAEVFSSAASSPDALAAMVKTAFGEPTQEIEMDGWAGPITSQDLIAGTYQVNSLLAIADNSHFQLEEGFLPWDHWESVRASIKRAAMENPFLLWRLNASLMNQRPGFRNELERLIAEIDEEMRLTSR